MAPPPPPLARQEGVDLDTASPCIGPWGPISCRARGRLLASQFCLSRGLIRGSPELKECMFRHVPQGVLQNLNRELAEHSDVRLDRWAPGTPTPELVAPSRRPRRRATAPPPPSRPATPPCPRLLPPPPPDRLGHGCATVDPLKGFLLGCVANAALLASEYHSPSPLRVSVRAPAAPLPLLQHSRGGRALYHLEGAAGLPSGATLPTLASLRRRPRRHHRGGGGTVPPPAQRPRRATWVLYLLRPCLRCLRILAGCPGQAVPGAAPSHCRRCRRAARVSAPRPLLCRGFACAGHGVYPPTLPPQRGG